MIDSDSGSHAETQRILRFVEVDLPPTRLGHRLCYSINRLWVWVTPLCRVFLKWKTQRCPHFRVNKFGIFTKPALWNRPQDCSTQSANTNEWKWMAFLCLMTLSRCLLSHVGAFDSITVKILCKMIVCSADVPPRHIQSCTKWEPFIDVSDVRELVWLIIC